MSQHAIEKKLNRECREPITTERQVVYILAEIRKLLELENAKDRYPALNFYCDWALHSRISKSAEARRIVEIFDRAERFFTQMDNTPAGQQMVNPNWDWTNQLSPVVELQNLKFEFGQFCELHSITGNLVNDEEEWLRFMDQYAGVIEDVPLISSDSSLQYVKKVTTRRIPIPAGMNAAEADKKYFLALQWEWMSPACVPKMTQKIFSHTTVPKSLLHHWWMRIRLFFAKVRFQLLHHMRKER
jgi:hypothetical protein